MSSHLFCRACLVLLLSLSPLAALAQEKAKLLTNSIGMKLVEIPAGSFTMGSPPDEAERDAGELSHKVTITRPFYLGVYEVSQREFKQIVTDNRQQAHFHASNGGGVDHPIENILSTSAVDFCTKLSAIAEEKNAGRTYRLPTEAEWEYACRAGTQTPFHYGDSLSAEQANFNGLYPYGSSEKGTYARKTMQVGSFQPNAFGLYDMHGNVAEWCADWYDKLYYQDSPEEDPLGPPEGAQSDGFGKFYVVARGGSWLDDARACRSAYRFRAMTTNNYKMIGFRVVCEVADSANEKQEQKN